MELFNTMGFKFGDRKIFQLGLARLTDYSFQKIQKKLINFMQKKELVIN
jgi:hypothetical protein